MSLERCKIQNASFKKGTKDEVPRGSGATRRAGFTLIELLVSMTILSFIMLMVAGLANVASQAWARGNQSSEVYQNGRAILDLISRDLRQAVISPRLQFIQSPSLGNTNQLGASSGLFWQANISSTSKGSLCEVGYYLNDQCELKRFFVPPDDTADYKIFDAGNPPAGSSGVYQAAAPWVTNYLTASNASGQPLATTVSDGVLGFWVRCIDANGDPIPYASDDIKYNSADPFQPAVPGMRFPSDDPSVNPSSFKPTAAGTAIANLLPYAVELYVLTVDKSAFERMAARYGDKSSSPPKLPSEIVAQNTYESGYTERKPPMGVPDNAVAHRDHLMSIYGIRTAKLFYTRVQVGTN